VRRRLLLRVDLWHFTDSQHFSARLLTIRAAEIGEMQGSAACDPATAAGPGRRTMGVPAHARPDVIIDEYRARIRWSQVVAAGEWVRKVRGGTGSQLGNPAAHTGEGI
jgi:hypothetical protein